MTVPQDLEPGRIVVRRQSHLPLEPTFRRQLVGWARVAMDMPGRALSLLFPRQSARPPFKLIPGFGARIEAELLVPGAREVHLFSETRTTAGGSALQATPAQVVPLDEYGRGTALVDVTARDENTTGQAEVRLVAVRPEYPDAVAADLPSLPVAQEGTAAITYSVLIGLLILGGLTQVEMGRLPILALMIVIALGFMSLNAPKFSEVRFEVKRLLPLRQRLLSAGLLILGAWVWGIVMYANVEGVIATEVNCGAPRARDCSRTYILMDNLTAIVASMGLALFVFLALAPAIRPRRLAGRMMLIAGLCPLLLYDLTLIGSLVSTTVRDFPYTLTTRVENAYPVIGWTMAGVGILLMSIRHGFGERWQKLLGGVTLTFCFLVLFSENMLFLNILTVFLLLVTSHALIVRPPRWVLLRSIGFAAVPVIVMPSDLLTKPLGMSILLTVAVVIGLVELAVWRRWRRRGTTASAMDGQAGMDS